MLRLQLRSFFSHTHSTEYENTCSSVLNRFPTGDSNRDTLVQDSVCQFCHDEIPSESCGNVCEVLKCSLHSFIDRLFLVTLRIRQKSLEIFTFFTQVKYGPQYNRS